ncbi:MAG: response regulator [Alphaproteobacteria bacterium]|nr:response regulator [Alphaproteobacteria bacterium]
MSVLLVEDTPPMSDLIVAMLADMNVRRVYPVGDGREALNVYRRNPDNFDIVISDWVMPKMTGLELLREVRAINADIPFMMLTVRTADDAIKDARDANVTGYITKPFKARMFHERMTTILTDVLERKANPPTDLDDDDDDTEYVDFC